MKTLLMMGLVLLLLAVMPVGIVSAQVACPPESDLLCAVAVREQAIRTVNARYLDLAETYALRREQAIRTMNARYLGFAKTYAREQAIRTINARYLGFADRVLDPAVREQAIRTINARYLGFAESYGQ